MLIIHVHLIHSLSCNIEHGTIIYKNFILLSLSSTTEHRATLFIIRVHLIHSLSSTIEHRVTLFIIHVHLIHSPSSTIEHRVTLFIIHVHLIHSPSSTIEHRVTLNMIQSFTKKMYTTQSPQHHRASCNIHSFIIHVHLIRMDGDF